jgi:hypothetical protein
MITPIRKTIDINVSPKNDGNDSDISSQMTNNPFKDTLNPI